ncbi:MAG: AAA family ATPase [Acidimicrobiales bacterium]
MTREPAPRNPYRPGAAVPPVFLAGRESQINRFSATLRAAPELPPNVRIAGLRGVGKTVLLRRLEEVAQGDGWATIRVQVEPRHNAEAVLADLINELCERASLKISRLRRLRETMRGVVEAAGGLVKVTWQDIELSMTNLDRREEQSIARNLYRTAARADQHGLAGLLLMFDEAQVIRDDMARDGEHPLSLLVAAANTLQEAGLPVGLVLCGLPTLRTNLLRARTYSERMFRGEEVSSLAGPEAVEAFVRPLEGTGVSADGDLVERVVEEVEGYPYFVQLWGAELWEAAHLAGVGNLSTLLLAEIEQDIYRRLDLDFYEPRVDSLTPAEQDLLLATTNCPYPPLKTGDIHTRSGKKEGNVNVLMGRLTEQGVLFRVQMGQYEYTAPKFHAYLQRRAARLAQSGR